MDFVALCNDRRRAPSGTPGRLVRRATRRLMDRAGYRALSRKRTVCRWLWYSCRN